MYMRAKVGIEYPPDKLIYGAGFATKFLVKLSANGGLRRQRPVRWRGRGGPKGMSVLNYIHS